MNWENKLLFGIIIFIVLQVLLFFGILNFTPNMHPLIGLATINFVPGIISLGYLGIIYKIEDAKGGGNE